MTHEQYVSLETAKLLKQAGFDWECTHRYSEGHSTNDSEPIYISPRDNWNQDKGRYSAPTQAVAQRWLREVKNMDIKTYYVVGDNWVGDDELKRWWQSDIGYLGSCANCGAGRHTTYEAALEAGLQKCLTLLIEKQ